MRTSRKFIALIAIGLLAGPMAANATVITSNVDPLLSGSSVITFTGLLGSTDPSISGVSFSGQSAPTLVLDSLSVSTSPLLGNQTNFTSGGNVDISFGAGMSAFGMMLWGVNLSTTIEAYDFAGSLLGTATLVSAGPFVDGFLGLGGFSSSIWSAKVLTTDFIGIDDVHFVTAAPPVPLPAAAWLLLSGLGGLIALARRRTA